MHKTHVALLCCCWYAVSALASQVTKRILTLCPLPLLLGEIQFVYTALLSVIACVIAYQSPTFYNSFPRGTFPPYFNVGDEHEARHVRRLHRMTLLRVVTAPSQHIFKTVLPLSLFQFVGKFFGHSATALVPISTVSSIKTLSPVCILIFQKMLGIKTLPITPVLILSLSTLILGVWLIVMLDQPSQGNKSSFSTYGVTCAVTSMLIFVGQNLYGKSVFTTPKHDHSLKISDSRGNLKDQDLPIYRSVDSDRTKKYDKLTLMLYISILGFISSFCWFIALELPVVWRFCMYDIQPQHKIIVRVPWHLYLVNGTFHFVQAMITFHLMGEVSTLTYSVANLMKRIAIISVSWLYSSDKITLVQILGLSLNMLGLFLYERCSKQL